MLNFALALMIFLLVSQAYSQEASPQLDESAQAQAVSVEPTADQKLEALQQQLLMLQTQVKELNQQQAMPAEVQAIPVAPAPVVQPQAVEKPAVVKVEDFDLDLSKQLRARKQILSWRYSYEYQKHKVTTAGSTGSVTSDGNRTQFDFEYGINLAFVEGGVRLVGIRVEDNDGDEVVQSDFSLVGRLNFIENRPGNNFVPYLAGYVGGLSIKYSSTPTYTLDGGYAGLGIGFNWFPFSEIFALNLELSHYSAGLESDTNPQIQTDSIATRLNVGWRVYF